jgi:hypothetical protein
MTVNKLKIVRSIESVTLDVETDNNIARLTIWPRGSNCGLCDSEILNVNTEARVLWKHDEYENVDHLRDIVQHLWRDLNSCDANSRVSPSLVDTSIGILDMLQLMFAP